MVQAWQRLEIISRWQTRIQEFSQTEFKYTIAYIMYINYMVYKIYRGNNQVPKEKGPTTTRVCCLCPTDQTGLHGNPARTPVRPVHRPVRPVWQKQRAAHLALKCATRRLPNLRVSLHDLTPLCIPADELDTTGAEVDVLGSWNNLGSNKSWATNTQQDLPVPWV